MPSLPQIRAFLDATPQASTALLILATFVLLRAWRHFSPATFEKLPRPLQDFPPLVIGAFLAWATAQVEILSASVGQGAFAGLGAIGLHWFLKRSPLPYGNPPKDPPSPGTVTRITSFDPPTPPGPGSLVALILAVALSGCSVARSINDARLDLCDLIGEERADEESAKVGMGPAEWLALWRATCLVRLEAAEGEAVGAIGGGS